MSFLFYFINVKRSIEQSKKHLILDYRLQITDLLDYSFNTVENEVYIKLGMTCRSQLTATLHLSQGHFFEMIFQDYLLKILNHHGALKKKKKLFVSQGKQFSTP